MAARTSSTLSTTSSPTGMFTFNGQTTGDGLADLLIGRFSALTDGNVISDYLRQTVMAAYVQDAFHATPHFSINIGVRWEPSVPAYDKYGRGNQFSWPLFTQGWHSPAYPGTPAGPGLLDGFGARSLRQSVHGIPLGDFLAPARPGLGSQRRWQADHSRVVQLQSRYHHAVLSRALDHQFAVCLFDHAYQRPVLQPVRELRQPPNWQDRRSVPRQRGLPGARGLRHHSGEPAGHWRDAVEPQLPAADCQQLGDQSQLHG